MRWWTVVLLQTLHNSCLALASAGVSGMRFSSGISARCKTSAGCTISSSRRHPSQLQFATESRWMMSGCQLTCWRPPKSSWSMPVSRQWFQQVVCHWNARHTCIPTFGRLSQTHTKTPYALHLLLLPWTMSEPIPDKAIYYFVFWNSPCCVLSLKLISFPFQFFYVSPTWTHTHTHSLSPCPHFLWIYILGHQYLYCLCRVSAGSFVNLHGMIDIGSEDDNMIGWIFHAICTLYAILRVSRVTLLAITLCRLDIFENGVHWHISEIILHQKLSES